VDVIEEFFVPSRALKLKLLDYIIEHPLEKLPTSKKLSEFYQISDITVKKVMGALASRGLLKSNKKGGTRIINRFSTQQRQAYFQGKEDIKSVIRKLEESGFGVEEILSCLYNAILEYTFDTTKLIYTERDPGMVPAGAGELSDILGVKVKAVYIENIQREAIFSENGPKAIIVPFYCYSEVEHLKDHVRIFPLRTTHPIEFLSTSRDIAYNSTVVYVAISEEDKEGVFSLKSKIENGTFRLLVYRIDEVTDDPHLLSSAEMVVAYKWIINNNEHLFKNVPKIIAYNRFDDKEGISMIRSFINSNKIGGQ